MEVHLAASAIDLKAGCNLEEDGLTSGSLQASGVPAQPSRSAEAGRGLELCHRSAHLRHGARAQPTTTDGAPGVQGQAMSLASKAERMQALFAS